jgi:hypothetical protein
LYLLLFSFEKKMAKRGKPDWEAVEKEYRLGMKSVRTLAEQYGCAHTTITRRAKKEGWAQDKSEEVQQRTKAALLAHQERTTPTREDIDVAVKTNVEVVRQHRALVQRTLNLVDRLLTDAEEEKTLDINKHGNLFRTVSQGLAKVIPLERQAFNLDDKSQTGETIEDIIKRVNG